MDLLGRLPQQEQATGDEDQVLPGKALAEHLDDGLGELDDPGHGTEQTQAQDQRQADADAAALLLLVRGQLVGQDGDEDEVVDAQHHFHHDQGGESSPDGRVGGEL
ncbi:hypothetical protein EHI8A_243340 [Entamoeba histolytica HM-1:IMSS-B]|uniref:Uncharacterized protein n=1 Tax=Entamoeba histolytica HM-1:IMSS-B TaxID=885319 RepID=M3TMX0_ENTH1|nr:hypothetical protein EHI8A_243340 [Entamoeba histolytica HM-1:IMSS-B]